MVAEGGATLLNGSDVLAESQKVDARFINAVYHMNSVDTYGG